MKIWDFKVNFFIFGFLGQIFQFLKVKNCENFGFQVKKSSRNVSIQVKMLFFQVKIVQHLGQKIIALLMK